MSFHDVRFPTGISQGSSGGPERRTLVSEAVNGREHRNQQWADSRRAYNAGYGLKSRADLYAVLEFFEERRGRLYGFRWHDRVDHSSSGGSGDPTPTDQELGVGDGTRTDFALVKRYGGAFAPYERRITRPVADTVVVAVGGMQTNAFTLTDLGTVRLDVPPDAGAAVTAGFLFDVPVRFDTDRLDVVLEHFDAGAIADIPIVEVREG
jgi:uncharacterized protein (TIGR02217 family)